MLLGIGSAVIDNVPLVAASMGMFSQLTDDPLWHFIAFSAGTGGSMLIIGSAAGVVAMGMEKIDFFWYFKKISWLAFLGFFRRINQLYGFTRLYRLNQIIYSVFERLSILKIIHESNIDCFDFSRELTTD